MKEEVKNLLGSVIRLFMKYGIKSVTMDDVSRELGISKKTLYQHFTDRSHLVDAAVESHLKYVENNCSQIFKKVDNAVEQMLQIAAFISEQTRNMNPNLLIDLKRYFPQSWKRLNDHRINFIYGQLKNNIDLGIEQGYYRKDFNRDIAALIYINIVEIILDQDKLLNNEYSFKEIQQEFIIYHLHAICTPKGIAMLINLKENKKP